MPQTREHLEVLRSLRVASGVVVISKGDLATDELLGMVRNDVNELVEGTFLQGAPVVVASAKTGDGIEDLKRIILELTRDIGERDRTGPFRLAVDRVFHMQGIGVVVTGSGSSGTVGVGDSLEILPRGKKARVREIQSFGEKREKGYAGERLAIALQGIKLDEIARGDMLVTTSAYSASSHIDARLRVADYAELELKHRERVRVHHFAREVLGRVLLLDADLIRSGEDGLVQLALEEPIVASEGDYFVVRKYSPTRVLGGGRVLVARAARHRRRDPAVIRDLELQETGDAAEKLLKAVETAGLNGVRETALDTETARALLRKGQIAVIDGLVFSRRVLAATAATIERLADEYVKSHPLRYGMDKEELRQRLRFPHPTALFNRFLEAVAGCAPLFVRENRVRTRSDGLSLPPDLRREMDRLEAVLRDAGVFFLRVPEIEMAWTGRSGVRDALEYLREQGIAVRLGDDGYMHAGAVEGCRQVLREWFQSHGELSVGDLKELLGVTRKHAVPLLEHLDRVKMTVREENVRRRGPALESGG
jgi:selenocysteine-specific elongation factor